MRNYKKTITLGLDYSEFEGGITECKNKMKLLDEEFAHSKAQMGDMGRASEQYALKTDYLTQKINLQQDKVKACEKKYNALMDAHADTSKIDKADAALLKERTELLKLEDQLQQTRYEQSEFKQSAIALGTVITTIAVSMGKFAKEAAEYADNIKTLSEQTSISTDTLQEWEYASELVDVSLETMTGSIQKMEKNMLSASNGSGEAAKAFAKLGVSITDSNGEMRGAEDTYYDVIDALKNVKNATEQDQLAMSIFGKSAADLTGVINAGSEGMKAYGEEAQELGRVMSGDSINKAAEFSDAMEKLSSAFDSLKTELGLMIIPLLTDLFEKIAAIPTPVLKTIAIIVSTVTVVVTLSKTINSVVSAGSAMSKAFKGVSSVMDGTYAKIVMVIAVVTALVGAITALVLAWKSGTGASKEFVNSMNAMGYGGNNKTGHNARGTQSWRGGSTWVGENGPELVDLPAGSRIYSNSETKNISGDKTYNITINADVSRLKSVSDVVDMVEGLGMAVQGGA